MPSMSACVCAECSVARRCAATCSRAYPNMATVTKSIGVVVPSMSVTIASMGAAAAAAADEDEDEDDDDEDEDDAAS